MGLNTIIVETVHFKMEGIHMLKHIKGNLIASPLAYHQLPGCSPRQQE